LANYNKNKNNRENRVIKKTRIGSGKGTKRTSPGPCGGNKKYKKRYRGQGRS
jgi:hypothetical protein